MLYEIVDNSSLLLLGLGIVALCFGAAWWTTRRGKWLIGSGVCVAMMALIFVLSLFVVSDRQRIERNIDEMRNAVNTGKPEEAARFFDDVVTVDTRTGSVKVPNQLLKAYAKSNMNHYQVKQVETGSVDFEEMTGSKAVVSFMVRADDDWGKTGRCRMEFTKTPQGKWLCKRFTVESYIGGQTSPVLFPFGPPSDFR
jgi:hypothetical protein